MPTAVRDVVGDLDRLVERSARDDRHDRPEDLFLRDSHRRRDVGEDGRLVKEAVRVRAGRQPLAAARERRAFLLADLDVAHDLLELLLADRRAHLRRRVEAIADAQRFGARRRIARRTRRRPSCARSPRLAAVQRCPVVPKPPHRRLRPPDRDSASSITMMAFLPPISRWTILKIGAAFWLTSLPTAVEPVNETTRHVRMRRQRRADGWTVPVTRLTTPGGMPASSSTLTKLIGRQRRDLGRLEDDGVAAHQRRNDLPRRNRHRKIPRRDHPAHADRLAHRHRELVAHLGRRGLPVQPPAFAGGEISHVDRFLDVAARLVKHLAHLARHVARELLPCGRR